MRPELDLILWRGGVGKATARLAAPEAVARMRERIERFALFDPAEYLSLSPDLEGLDALDHYAEYGVWEPHRRFVGEKTIAAWLGEVSQAPLPGPEAASGERLARALAEGAGVCIGVHVNRASSWRAHDLGARLVRGLIGLGLHAELLDEQADRRADVRRIFVAPHEFFTQREGAAWATLELLSRSVMYSTVAPETPEFRAAVPYLLACGGVVEPHPQAAVLFSRAGVPALSHLPTIVDTAPPNLPDDPVARALPRAARAYDDSRDVWVDRPIDLAFFGTETDERDAFFGSAAARLADLSCVIHMTRRLGGPMAQQPGDQRAALHAYVGRRSKIALNLARDAIQGVGWRRMVLDGFAQRALVVSTPCLPHPVFRPGVHYLEDSWRRLPQLIDWLLRSDDGRLEAERVRQQGYAALMEHAPPRRMAGALAAFVLEHAR
jgi:hypothetical protein